MRALRILIIAVLCWGWSSTAARAAQHPSYDLPTCAANRWVDGLAVERWDNGDFKVVITPSVDGFTFGVLGRDSVWHLAQACIPGLYGPVADTIWAQLDCHAQLSALPNVAPDYLGSGGGFATGPSWDLESWNPRPSPLTYVTSHCGNGADPVDKADGTWTVSFGVEPALKSQQDLDRLRNQSAATPPPAAPAFAQQVTVLDTGGEGLFTRGGPGYDASLGEVLPDGTPMTLLCQVHGESITDVWSTDLWDQVRLVNGRQVWVSDRYVWTGSDDQVAPTC